MKRNKRAISFLLLMLTCGVFAFAVDILQLEDSGGVIRFQLGDTGNALFTGNDGTGPALKVIQNGLGKIFALFDGGTEVVTVLDGGNVGIGNTTPAEKLVVAGVIQSTTGGVKFPDGTIQAQASKVHQGGPVYRWMTFSQYDQAGGWIDGNATQYFGGVNPSNFGDGNYRPFHLTSDKDVLRTMFTYKGYAGKNAVVYNRTWYNWSSTDTWYCMALFRIRNTTGAAINWSCWFTYTAWSGWGNYAGIAVNGTEPWNSATGYSSWGPTNVTLSIPAGPTRVSTVIFGSSSSPVSGNYRSCFLGFANNCLVLPAGLEWVDDFDTATGDWTQ